MGKFEVLREIARGGMSTVYLGRDPFADRLVALKVSHGFSFADDVQRTLYEHVFFNELRVASLLHHPYIVEVYDAGIEAGSYYIAMEHVAGGGSLQSHCSPGHLLALETIAEIIFRCAEALDYAHRKGVVHRDIKPANILVGGGMRVKLADFGASLLAPSPLEDTQPMGLMGSPLYMSPEQLRDEPLTQQTDLFSLGVVMYELIAGRHPFAADSLGKLANRILHEGPPPIWRFRPEVPAFLEHILERALARDCAQRYRTALDLAADLSMAFACIESPQDGLETESRVDLLKRLSFFQEFPTAEVWELLRWAKWHDYPDGELIIEEGTQGDAFFIIISGQVQVRKEGQIITSLKQGDFFGEIGYLAKGEHAASIIADGPVSALSLNAAIVDRASEGCQITFQRVFISTLIERLINTTHLLAKAGFRRSET